MSKKMTIEWLYAATMRALKTMAQTALGMFTVGQAMGQVNWGYVASVSLVSGLYSILTSFATKLPEVGSDGQLQIDTTDPQKDVYRIAFDGALESLSEKKKVTLTVDPKANLSQQ